MAFLSQQGVPISLRKPWGTGSSILLCQGTGEQASERAGAGAAMIAGIGSGVFDGYQDTQKLAPIFNVVTEPNRDTVALYEPHYRSFLEIYPRMKSWRAI
jgi:sugar (pentulose or hexulose) kinase